MNLFNQSGYSSIHLSLSNLCRFDKINGLYTMVLKLLFITKRSLLTAVLLLASCYQVQAATNTGLRGDDVVTRELPIGFNFTYYNQNFTQFYVSTNGLLQFSNPTAAYSNYCLPAANNTLYVFWDDLRTNVSKQPDGPIHYETQGDAPNRQLIVQWTNQYFFGSNLPMGTFQVILYEGSNQIKYQYRYLIDERSLGNSATIGIQGPARQFQQIGCNKGKAIEPEQAILFTPTAEGTDYIVDTRADYEFIDISGLTLNSPIASARYITQAPEWHWEVNTSLNTYQINILDESGIIVHEQVIGNVERFTYPIEPVHGKTYRARIRGSINNGGTWEMWSALSGLTTIDLVGPTLSLDGFSRISSDKAKIAYAAHDDLSGIQSISFQIATDAAFSNIVASKDIVANNTGSASVTSIIMDSLPADGTLYARMGGIDKLGNRTEYTPARKISVTPPVIVQPVRGTVVLRSALTVMGTAEVDSTVQLYLNDIAVGARLTVNDSGQFEAPLSLAKEGNYRLTADVKNSFGTSSKSTAIDFAYKIPAPTAIFVTPDEGVTLSAPIDIEVSARDDLGIAKVELFADEQLLASVTEPPYLINWDVNSVANGVHKLKAVVTNVSGKSATLLKSVNVLVIPPAPPPTVYTGEVKTISPASTYGFEPISITGRAVYRADSKPVLNAPLKLILVRNGLERRISLATDETGAFSYTFVPPESDAGIYDISAIHPDESVTTSQGRFAINRIKFNLNRYSLTAARNVTSQINVNAAASAGTSGLRWLLRAEDQPDGRLPEGIQINGGNGVDIAAGKSVPILIDFTANDSAQVSGMLTLVALANDSAELIRGKLQVYYRLVPAMPNLHISSTVINTGVRQGQSVTESLTLGNKGLTAAENVQIKLLSEDGTKPPAWMFLASAETIGSVNVGDSVALQIVAQPDNSVADGIYRFKLVVTAGNAAAGNIPVSVSVTQSGEGGVRFDVADIYTATPDSNGQPIPGVKGATIKLQNEAVLTEQYTITTDSQGIALINKLPAGIYRYRASAPEHLDSSGRVIVRSGATASQHIFLEYETISIEFGVTEKTINDVYDIELQATFNTRVPAPIVLLEPLSINLAGMINGEERTGQLTLTNYGLVQAENVAFSPPSSDSHFRYEFFAEVPSVLPAKTRIVIPYRVTALGSSRQEQAARAVASDIVFRMLNISRSSDDCTSYLAKYTESHSSICANGDESRGSNSGTFYRVTGTGCSNGNLNWWSGWGGGGGGGGSGWGNGSWGSPSPIPMTSGCTPDCGAACCVTGGSGAAN